jgi:hypothetical protein
MIEKGPCSPHESGRGMPLLEQFKPDIMTFPQGINRLSLLDIQATYSYIRPTLKVSCDQLNMS